MKPNKAHKKISKILSLILRHKPEEYDITLDEHGWASTDHIIKQLVKKGVAIDLNLLLEVVNTSDKKRFILKNDNSLIRANQGHSINIDLDLNNTRPPSILYHGTATKNKQSIEEHGLNKAMRNHVHLSDSIETAFKVGQRHGIPLIFRIDTASMFEDGCQFYLSENKVWLTDYIAPKYISIYENKE